MESARLLAWVLESAGAQWNAVAWGARTAMQARSKIEAALVAVGRRLTIADEPVSMVDASLRATILESRSQTTSSFCIVAASPRWVMWTW